MKAGTRLLLYAVGLVVAFGAAFGLAGVVVPDKVVAAWTDDGEMESHSEAGGSGHGASDSLKGLSLSSGGYTLSPVAAPASTATAGRLSFTIQDASGEPVTDFAVAHEKQLHLIVVRTDGTEFRHVHPELDPTTGEWSLPWKWTQPGTYRVYADFTPAVEGAQGLTLTRAVQVEGEFSPVVPELQRVDEVDDFTVTLGGDLVAGQAGDLELTVTRDGEPVTTLEPYLGAFGHLVALRDGDLAYLHVHAEGDEPQDGQLAGPDIAFVGEAPTAGRYLLYLDFQVDGRVHTAEFVLEATRADGASPSDDTPSSEADSGHTDSGEPDAEATHSGDTHSEDSDDSHSEDSDETHSDGH